MYKLFNRNSQVAMRAVNDEIFQGARMQMDLDTDMTHGPAYREIRFLEAVKNNTEIEVSEIRLTVHIGENLAGNDIAISQMTGKRKYGRADTFDDVKKMFKAYERNALKQGLKPEVKMQLDVIELSPRLAPCETLKPRVDVSPAVIALGQDHSAEIIRPSFG